MAMGVVSNFSHGEGYYLFSHGQIFSHGRNERSKFPDAPPPPPHVTNISSIQYESDANVMLYAIQNMSYF